jgi:predicted Holliday junction resolvase-like endonuclease
MSAGLATGLLILALLALVYLGLRYALLRARVDREAMAQLDLWRRREIDSVREVALRDAEVQLARWQAEVEDSIRRDAVLKSESVTRGKVAEHFVPYLPGFDYDPRDARFLGSAIDFIVFDGLSNGDVRSVIFVEVKTGRSALNSRERRVRDAVRSGRVEWLELRPALDGGDDGK